MKATQPVTLRIDDNFLRQYEILEEEGQPSLLKEIILRFTKSAPERLKKIRDAINMEESTILQFEAHALKGIVGNVGANKLSLLCQIMEIKGENQSLKNLESLFQEMTNEYLAVAGELQARAVLL
jgi:HPt (histidine-containing phosphotransfer) domain-containing protein